MKTIKAGETYQSIVRFSEGAWAIIQAAYAASPTNVSCEFEKKGHRENTIGLELSQTGREILLTAFTDGWELGIWKGDIRVVHGNYIHYFPSGKEYITFEIVPAMTEPEDKVEA